MSNNQKTVKKEINVHLSVYIPIDKDMTAEEAKVYAHDFLEARGLEEFQIYEADVQEKE